MTKYKDLLERVINDGIEACKKDYAPRPDKLEGAIAGFEACRGKTPIELREVLIHGKEQRNKALARNDSSYWRWRCYEAEIEWVCNVISAALVNEKQNPIIEPTGRGLMKAAEILGVKDGPIRTN